MKLYIARTQNDKYRFWVCFDKEDKTVGEKGESMISVKARHIKKRCDKAIKNKTSAEYEGVVRYAGIMRLSELAMAIGEEQHETLGL